MIVSTRTAGYLGIAGVVISWLAIFVFGALRPSYSQSVNAVMELGALGSPNALLFNVIGYIVPVELQNGVLLLTSQYTTDHFFISVVYVIAWQLAALLLILSMRRNAEWCRLHIANGVLVALFVAPYFALSTSVPDALIERIAGAFYCAWIVVMSIKLIKLGKRELGQERAVLSRL